MARYPEEMKQAIIENMMPPNFEQLPIILPQSSMKSPISDIFLLLGISNL